MKENTITVIREIQGAMEGTEKIPASRVRGWLQNPSVEILGAVTQHVIRQSRRVEPPLSMEEICRVVQNYYRECLIQNLEGKDYAPNRHVAGYELVGWFKSLWRDPAVPREYVKSLKAMLQELLVSDTVPRDEIVTAVLEHLFETPTIADFFSDWKSDPRLQEPFDLAMEWAREHSEKPS